MRWLAGFVAALGASLMVAAPAQAQEGFNAHGFQITAQDGDPRDPFTVSRAGRFHAGEGWFSLAFEYADDPLEVDLEYPDSSTLTPPDTTTVIDSLAALNITGGYAIADAFRLHVSVPVFVSSDVILAQDVNLLTGTNDDGSRVSRGDIATSGGGIGDLRVAGQVALARPSIGSGFGFSLVPFLDLPTGNQTKFLGRGGVGFGLKMASSIEAGGLTLSGDLGFGLNPGRDLGNYAGGAQVLGGVGLGYLLVPNGALAANVEAHFMPALNNPLAQGSVSPSEVMVGLRGRLENGFHYGAGFGKAIGDGAGGANMRILAQVGFGILRACKDDKDCDEIWDEDDQCPTEAEVYNDYEDADGCPDEGGRVFVTAYLKGQVEEYVEITIDGADLEGNPFTTKFETTLPDPNSAMVPAGDFTITADTPGFQATQQLSISSGEYPIEMQLTPVTPARVKVIASDSGGNPLPRVGLSVIEDGASFATQLLDDSGVVDFDIPPGEYVFFITAPGVGQWRRVVRFISGESKTVEARLGSIRIDTDRIHLMDNVYFDTGSATIKAQSFSLLDQVAGALVQTPDILQLEVQGHTDSQGGEGANLDLSQRRAQSVVNYLTRQGVEGGRLTAVGYGESQPIESNETAEGRAANRRVELIITERMNR